MAAGGATRPVWRPAPRSFSPGLRRFGIRAWVVAGLAALVVGVVTGIPVVMIENRWFLRMTPVRPQDYVVWVVSAVLIGLIAGTFVVTPKTDGASTTAAGGLLSYLAIGCPICNKVAVLLLGVGGALSIFGPAQLLLGLLSVALLSWTLLLRMETITVAGCSIRET